MISTQIMQAAQKLQLGSGFGTLAGGQALQTEAQTNMTDAQIATQHQMVDKATAEKIAADHYMGDNYSACAIAQRSRLTGALESARGAMTLAMVTAHPAADTASNAKTIASDAQLGLQECSDPNSSEYLTNKSNGCQQKFNGHFEHAADSMDIIFQGYQLPVPPDYNPPKPGVFVPFTQAPSQEKYMPFVAAVRYCQKLMPHPPGSAPGNGKNPSIATLSKPSYDRAVAKANTAYGMCLDLISERMQFGSSMQSGAFRKLHDVQAKLCDTDAKTGYTDGDPQFTYADGSSGSCQSDGRSLLQARHDKAYRQQSKSFAGKYTVGLARADVIRENSSASDAEDNFMRTIGQERMALSQAIAASQVSFDAPSGLDRPTQ